jgi:hypothetical protein
MNKWAEYIHLLALIGFIIYEANSDLLDSATHTLVPGHV